MTKQRLYLFDTTLRDGAQTLGVDFSLEDKKRIARLLDELGIDYIEGGYPGANPTDSRFFARPPELARARLTAFGMTKRAGRSVSNDPGFGKILNAEADAICLVAKSWDYHVEVALGISLAENLEAIRSSIEAGLAAGREVMIDCEHFFDGYAANPDYALDCARTAYDAGARWVVLCDTNGGRLPGEIRDTVQAVCRELPGSHIGIHCHNDTEQAVANSLAAIEAGARQIQGTLNGLGERCGNANLVSLLPTVLLKEPYRSRFETGVSAEQLKTLTHVSRVLDDILNRPPDAHAPYVGPSAFAHKGGIHVSAVMKAPATYEHVPPEAVGNQRRVLVSNQAGRSNILAELDRVGISIEKDNPLVRQLLDEVKRREAAGYAYEGADASFALLARRMLGQVPHFFHVDSFRVIVGRRHRDDDPKQQMAPVLTSEATVKIRVADRKIASVAHGAGPVHALDQALRKDLGIYQKYIDDIELVDYKVRILTGGTEAITRVLIESRDAAGARWFTIGVSANIVDASFDAIIDSIYYKLLRDQAPAPAGNQTSRMNSLFV